MSDVTLKIVLDDAHRDKPDEVCRALTAAGLRIENSIPAIGVIFGTADSENLERLKATEGVLEAEPEAGYQLPPLDSNTPQ
ncbi:hypothetical protein [Marinovum sp.]|uniref:hypothetical protein n=1 Tax=Marinovum sp. TaxID=2024839 RepID=UPI003A901BF8